LPTLIFAPDQPSSLVEAVTGWQTSDHEIFAWGNRRLQLMRIYNLREGVTGEADRLPARFFDGPLDAGRHQGIRLDRHEFTAAKQLYYELSGWDQAGVPRRPALVTAGLGWAAVATPG
jgi:aldehyde:ferredoxin oxidoreductase